MTRTLYDKCIATAQSQARFWGGSVAIRLYSHIAHMKSIRRHYQRKGRFFVD